MAVNSNPMWGPPSIDRNVSAVSIVRYSAFNKHVSGNPPGDRRPELSSFSLQISSKGLSVDGSANSYLKISATFWTRIDTYSARRASIGGVDRMTWAYQRYTVGGTLEFSPTDGRPIRVVNDEASGLTMVDSLPFNVPMENQDPGAPLYPGQRVWSGALSATPPYGHPKGPIASVGSAWPMWEISGANFRFFGQNWIRLIKVSGP